MQLNLKNFRGTDKNGFEYRITLENRDNEVIFALKQIKRDNKWLNTADVAAEFHDEKKPLTKALRLALEKLGKELNLELLKPTPEPLLKTA